MTTLRNIVGGMDLEETLTSRDEINSGLRGVLDEATGKWGIRVNRVELKGIDPPPSIKDSMEKQMRADREKRAVILTAEGQRQAAILTAEGSKQSAILNAEGDRESQILRAQADREASILRAQGEGQAIQTVFQAIHDGQPDQSLLAYQYLQMMPKIAEGGANKVWVIPSEITKALEGLGSSIHEIAGIPRDADAAHARRHGPLRAAAAAKPAIRARGTSKAVEEAIAAAESAAQTPTRDDGRRSGRARRSTPPAEGEPPQAVSPLEAVLIAARRGGGRHHQHRGGVGNADHVPDPARVRRPAGDRQRLATPSAWCPGRCPASSATARELAGPARRACCAWGRRRSLGGIVGAVLLLVLPSAAFDAIVPVLIAARRAARRLRPADPARGRRARRGARRHPRPRRLVGVAGRGRGRRVRRLLRRRAGRAADGDPRHRRRRLDAAAQRRPRTSSPCSSTASPAIVFIAVADVDWASPA